MLEEGPLCWKRGPCVGRGGGLVLEEGPLCWKGGPDHMAHHMTDHMTDHMTYIF